MAESQVDINVETGLSELDGDSFASLLLTWLDIFHVKLLVAAHAGKYVIGS